MSAPAAPAPDSAPGAASSPAPLPPGLYLVATPIGNARDITLRALDVLATAGLLAAEDTRNTRKLLDIHGIRRPPGSLLAYHDHNGPQMRPRLLAALAEGQSVALVSDAGTPLVADPGFRLALEARAAGHPVTAVPGASAPLAALSIAGLPTDRFLFAGFLPPKSAARRSTADRTSPTSSTTRSRPRASCHTSPAAGATTPCSAAFSRRRSATGPSQQTIRSRVSTPAG